MKSLRVLCVLVGLISSALALDREAFTFTKYDLVISLEPQQQRLGARGKVTLRNDSAQPQKIAVLQISSSLTWHSIKVDGKPVQYVTQPYTSDIDHTAALSEAIVTLPAEIKPKDSVELEIGYEGTIVQDSTRLTQIGVPEDIAKHTSWDQISPAFSAVRGAGYVAWYPIATEAADFSEGNSMFQVADRWRAREAEAAMTINLCAQIMGTVPLMIMNEPPRKEGIGGGYDHVACSGFRFERLGIIIPAFVVGHFTQVKLPQIAWSIEVYTQPGHEESASTYASGVEPAVKFVGSWFGPSPTSAKMIDLPDSNAAPFESGSMLFVPMVGADAKLAELNFVHEFVHTAFTSPRPWISEGLAHFAEAIYREQRQDGRTAAIDFLNLHRIAFVEAEKDVSATPQKNSGQPLATTFDESYYRSKAAYVWWMLRDMIGDDALKQAIHNYSAADDKDTKYVEQLITSASKRDLAWFFDDWVYHDRGLPDFHVLAVHSQKSTQDTQIVAVTLENLGAAGAEVPFTIRFGTGEITRRIEVRAKATATTRVEVPGTPTEVVVNDGSVPESDLTNNVFKISESQ